MVVLLSTYPDIESQFSQQSKDFINYKNNTLKFTKGTNWNNEVKLDSICNTLIKNFSVDEMDRVSGEVDKCIIINEISGFTLKKEMLRTRLMEYCENGVYEQHQEEIDFYLNSTIEICNYTKSLEGIIQKLIKHVLLLLIMDVDRLFEEKKFNYAKSLKYSGIEKKLKEMFEESLNEKNDEEIGSFIVEIEKYINSHSLNKLQNYFPKIYLQNNSLCNTIINLLKIIPSKKIYMFNSIFSNEEYSNEKFIYDPVHFCNIFEDYHKFYKENSLRKQILENYHADECFNKNEVNSRFITYCVDKNLLDNIENIINNKKEKIIYLLKGDELLLLDLFDFMRLNWSLWVQNSPQYISRKAKHTIYLFDIDKSERPFDEIYEWAIKNSEIQKTIIIGSKANLSQAKISPNNSIQIPMTSEVKPSIERIFMMLIVNRTFFSYSWLSFEFYKLLKNLNILDNAKNLLQLLLALNEMSNNVLIKALTKFDKNQIYFFYYVSMKLKITKPPDVNDFRLDDQVRLIEDKYAISQINFVSSEIKNSFIQKGEFVFIKLEGRELNPMEVTIGLKLIAYLLKYPKEESADYIKSRIDPKYKENDKSDSWEALRQALRRAKSKIQKLNSELYEVLFPIDEKSKKPNKIFMQDETNGSFEADLSKSIKWDKIKIKLFHF